VRSGESLWSIANRYGTTISQVKSSSGLSSNIIRPGQKLTVFDYKSGSSKTASNDKYTVRSGDSLWTIAKRFGTSVSRIKQKNNIKGSSIHPGNVLVID